MSDRCAELINQISEIVCGYREASEEDIFHRLSYLVWLDRNNEVWARVQEIVDAVDDLNAIIEDAKSEHRIATPQPPTQE